MKLIKYPSKEQWAELLKRPALNTESLFDTVRTIINKVRAEGDKAVLEYEAALDKVTLSALTVTSEEMQKAEGLISDELKSAITLAKRNIETFHSSQRFVGKKVETMEGVTCWQKAVGIEKPRTTALTSMVTAVIWALTYALGIMKLIEPGFYYVLLLVLIVLSAVAIYGCYKNICPAGQENAPLRRKTGIGFIDRFFEKVDEKEARALETTRAEIEERQRRRAESRKSKRKK